MENAPINTPALQDKRLLAVAVLGALAWANSLVKAKFGFGLSDEQLAGLAAVVVAWVLQSSVAAVARFRAWAELEKAKIAGGASSVSSAPSAPADQVPVGVQLHLTAAEVRKLDSLGPDGRKRALGL